jgi:hypothetical protein
MVTRIHRPTGDQRATEQERDPPAPRLEGGVGQGGRHDPEDTGGQQVAGGHADLGPAGVPAAPVGLAVLQRHQHGPAPLAAQPESLDEAEHDRQDGRGHADGRVGRQQADEKGGDAHQQQGHHQHGQRPTLSPKWPKMIPPIGRAMNPVAEVARPAASR